MKKDINQTILNVINYNIFIQTKVEKISKNSEVIKMPFILKFQVLVID
jgi:hypothetical protein